MNILYIANHLNVGGITSYVLTLATGLKKRGHEVHIASSGGQLLSRFQEAGINYIHIPIKTKSEINPKILVSACKLSSAVKKYNIDIAHSNSRTTQVLGCLLARFVDIPHISTCHGFFKKKVFRKIFPCWGQKVIAISESVKEHLMKDFAVREEDIRVIYNGIDMENLKATSSNLPAEEKKNFGLGEGPVVGILARLSDVKGHIYLIEAMKNVLEKLPHAQLLIVGEGKMQKELVALVNRLGIEKNVFFMPSVNDTKEVLSIMDLFVMPSLKEGLGLALMEAMSSGLPVIGSDVGGIKSLIQDGYNGLLIKPADSQGLARAIMELLQTPERAKNLGRNARIFINQNFSQEKMVLETQKLYLECLPR